LAAVGVTVLADDHGRANAAFARVVVVRNVLMIQKRKQLGLVPAQAFQQTPRVLIWPRRLQQRVQPILDALPLRRIVRRRPLAVLAQTDRIAQQAPQLLGETLPGASRLFVLLDAQQLTQQMRNAFLLRQRFDRVVSAPEVATKIPRNSRL